MRIREDLLEEGAHGMGLRMVKVSVRRNVGERWHSKREWEDSGVKMG